MIQSCFAAMSLLLLAVSPGWAEEPTLEIEAGMHAGPIMQMAVDRAGRYLVTASTDGTVRVWDLLAGGGAQTLRLPMDPGGGILAAGLAPDGRTMAVARHALPGEEGTTLYFIDRRLGRVGRRIGGMPVITRLVFSADGRRLIAVLGVGGIRALDAASGAEIGRDEAYPGPCADADLDEAGRLVTGADDGQVRLYDPSLRLLRKAPAPDGREPVRVRFSPDGRKIAVASREPGRVDILSGEDLGLLYFASTGGPSAGPVPLLAWSRSGAALHVAAGRRQDGHQVIRRLSGEGRAGYQDLPVSPEPLTALVPLPQEGLAFATAAPSFGLMAANGTLTRREVRPIARFGRDRLAVDRTGGRVGFSYDEAGARSALFSVPEHALSPGAQQDARLRGPIRSAPGLEPTGCDGRSAALINGTPIPLPPDEICRVLAVDPVEKRLVLGGARHLLSVDGGGQVQWRAAVSAEVAAVQVSGDGRVVVAALGDGTLRWFGGASGKELLALLPHVDRRRWIAWTPSGYYDTSVGGEELLGWRAGRGPEYLADFFPVGLFRERFHRPDVVARVLFVQEEGRLVEELNAESGRQQRPVPIRKLLPPVVTILDPADGSAVDRREVLVRVALRSPSGERVTGLRATIQGRMTATRDILIVDDRDGKEEPLEPGETLRELRLQVPPENSTAVVVAQTPSSRGGSALLHLRWSGSQARPIVDKPNLYVVAVGVSRYQERRLRLTYPAKDAADLTAALKDQEGRRYRRVEVRVLTDTQASRDNILEALSWLRLRTGPQDVAALFLAGHGINSSGDGRYHFLPYDADLLAPVETMVDGDQVQGVLRSIRGRVLLFLDTCHAGHVLGPRDRHSAVDLTRFTNELASVESGVVVFAASTGGESAREAARWGNGAFTKAAVEGLRGKADTRRTGRITVSMLETYISERVRELTRDEQTPTTAKPGTVPDFLLVTLTPQPPLYRRWWFWGTLAVGAAAIAVAVALGVSYSAPDTRTRLDFSMGR